MVIRELITKLGFRVDEHKLRQFDKNVRAIKSEVQELTHELGSMARTVRNVGLGMTAAFSVPLTALGILSVKAKSNLDSARIALEVFLGSQEKALTIQKKLLAFAGETPLEMLGIQETAGQLLAAGVEADNLIETLNALGNAAKGNTAIFQRLVLNFAQVKTQGKLMGTELKDFLVAQVPLIRLLAKELNVAEKDIKKMSSEGKISFKDVQQAFFNASKEGGFFFDLMRKQSKTLTGRFSNLKDAVFRIAAVFGNAIDRAFNLTKNLDVLINFIDNLRTSFENLNPKIQSVIIGLLSFVAILGPIIAVLGTIAGAIISIKGLMFVLGGLGISLTPVLLVIGKVVAIISAISIAIGLLVEDFFVWKNSGSSVIGTLLGDFDEFSTKVERITKHVSTLFTEMWTAIKTNSDEAWNDVANTLGEMIEKFIVNLPNAIKFFWKIWERIWKGVNTLKLHILDKTLKLVLGTIERISKALGILKINVAEKVSTILPSPEKVHNVATTLSGALAPTGFGSIANLLPPLTLPPNDRAKTQVNVDSKISVQIPTGTPETQKRFIEEKTRAVVHNEMVNVFGKTALALQRTEQ